MLSQKLKKEGNKKGGRKKSERKEGNIITSVELHLQITLNLVKTN